MTTFGGATIPPIFTGGAQDGIFIRGVGLPHFNPSNTSIAATNLDLPTRQPGDLLVAYAGQYSGNLSPAFPTAVFWTADTMGGGGSTISFRVATNDADDNYLVPFVLGVNLGVQFFCQMISLASADPAKNVELFDEGTQSSFNTETFPLDSIPAQAEPTNTLVIGIYQHWYSQGFSTLMPTSMGDPTGLNLIGKHVTGLTRTDTNPAAFQYFVSGWGSVYQATSAAIGSQFIPYLTPLVTGSAQVRSQYFRYRAV